MSNELNSRALAIQEEVNKLKIPVHLKMLPEVGRLVSLVKDVGHLLVDITEKIGDDDGRS